jgi:hypothetical protein
MGVSRLDCGSSSLFRSFGSFHWQQVASLGVLTADVVVFRTAEMLDVGSFEWVKWVIRMSDVYKLSLADRQSKRNVDLHRSAFAIDVL